MPHLLISSPAISASKAKLNTPTVRDVFKDVPTEARNHYGPISSLKSINWNQPIVNLMTDVELGLLQFYI